MWESRHDQIVNCRRRSGRHERVMFLFPLSPFSFLLRPCKKKSFSRKFLIFVWERRRKIGGEKKKSFFFVFQGGEEGGGRKEEEEEEGEGNL